MSLRENIAFNDKVTNESLEKAIATAELTEFIESLPQKLDTIVSERGTSLSGGQKQRIMLARALALNPKILLLDDFTSRIDRKTENKILCNLENNYPDLTLISVTQKIAPVRHFEQIILLMEGEVIATGKHKELKKIHLNIFRYTTPNEAPTTMNYNLNQGSDNTGQKISNLASLRKLMTLIGEERRNMTIAFAAIFLNAGLSLLGPYLIGFTIDTYIQSRQYHGVLVFAAILLTLYILHLL